MRGNRFLFCNVAWMEHYDLALYPDDRPKHGGAYVSNTGEAYEDMNFHRFEDGFFYGFVESGYHGETANQADAKQLRIENLDSSLAKAEEARDVTVVFCAHSDDLNNTVIVGWYNNATVLRRRRQRADGHIYNLISAEAVVLPVSARVFCIPRASRAGIGFGQSNVWYAAKNSSASLVNAVREYTENPYEDFSEGQIRISVDQWRGLIRNGVLNERDLGFLAKFYAAPGHATTCLELTKIEGKKPNAYNAIPKSIGIKVNEALLLPVMKWKKSDQKLFFPIFFLDRVIKGHLIEWCLRPELVLAMEAECPELIGRTVQQVNRQEEAWCGSLTNEEIYERARKSATYVPSAYEVKTVQYSRNGNITLAARRRAGGTCQLCGKVPFYDPKGEAYLEVHHIIPLADGGPDTLENVAALCPNCHRKMHVLKDKQDIQTLIEKAKKRYRVITLAGGCFVWLILFELKLLEQEWQKTLPS